MTEFDQRMMALRARFVARATEEAGRIEAHLASGAWGDLRDVCHGLAGRAGMFGFPAVGEAARAVEEAIDAEAVPERIRPLAEALLIGLREMPQGR